ncbi:MAG TPA: DUF3857 domain-containing protein [Bacteroidales bacterium]|nr:DUF3857 domain-containing protein [Bacteroidales bacterium]
MKTVSFVFLIILSSLPANAGFRTKSPIRWGKVSPAEFKLLPPGKDSESSALVLCDFGDIEITNRTFYKRHTRILILNEEGLEYATVEIPYETNNRHDDFYELKARTLVMENGEIVIYNVPSGQIENIRINEKWSKKKFTFPHVKPGAIIEYRYVIASLDFEKLDTWYFQREIPVLWSEVRFQAPDPFMYLVTYANNRPLSGDEEIDFGKKLEWLYNTRQRPRRMELARNSHILFSTGENKYKVWAMNNMKKKIVMKNMPALTTGAGNEPVSAFYPQLRFHLFESSGNLPRNFRPLLFTVRDDYETRGEWSLMRDRSAYIGYVHYRLKTWTQFNEKLLESERFGRFLLRQHGGTRLIDSLTAGKPDGRGKMHAVYDFVRKNFSWNGEYASAAGQDFGDFIRKRSGSSAELNLLLVNMLQHTGMQADPVLIRTANLGIPEKLYPVKDQFNHVIVAVQVAGEQYLLDVTSNSPGYNELNVLDIGTQGWIVSENNPGWLEIFAPGSGKDSKEELPRFRL